MGETTFARSFSPSTAAARPRAAEGQLRILFAGSSGGHLATLHRLRPWWEHHQRLWVTFDTPDARSLLEGERVIPAHHPTTRNLPNAVRNLGLARRVLGRYRPDLVVSNGAGVALPFFLVARAMGIRTVFIEAIERVESRSLTGRLCYPLSDLFLLQWEEQRALYPRGIVIGRLL